MRPQASSSSSALHHAVAEHQGEDGPARQVVVVDLGRRVGQIARAEHEQDVGLLLQAQRVEQADPVRQFAHLVGDAVRRRDRQHRRPGQPRRGVARADEMEAQAARRRRLPLAEVPQGGEEHVERVRHHRAGGAGVEEVDLVPAPVEPVRQTR